MVFGQVRRAFEDGEGPLTLPDGSASLLQPYQRQLLPGSNLLDFRQTRVHICFLWSISVDQFDDGTNSIEHLIIPSQIATKDSASSQAQLDEAGSVQPLREQDA